MCSSTLHWNQYRTSYVERILDFCNLWSLWRLSCEEGQAPIFSSQGMWAIFWGPDCDTDSLLSVLRPHSSHSCVLMIHLIESKWSDFLFTHRNYVSIFIIIPLDEIALRRGPSRSVVTRLHYSSAMPTGVVNGNGSAWPALITTWALKYPSWIPAAPNRPVLNIFSLSRFVTRLHYQYRHSQLWSMCQICPTSLLGLGLGIFLCLKSKYPTERTLEI